MAGRNRSELSGVGAPAELARRLRALRDERELTLRKLAARSGYSLASLSSAESGKRVPSWEVTAAFVQSCSGDPETWRQLWELATGTAADARAIGGSTVPRSPPASHAEDLPDDTRPAGNKGDLIAGPGIQPAPRRALGRGRWPRRRVVAAILIACACLSVGSIIGMDVLAAGRVARPHSTLSRDPAARPRSTATAPSSALGTAAGPYPVRRHDEVTLLAGERIGLDAAAGGPWPIGTSGGWPPYDLEFTLSDRLLVSVGTQTTGASLAWIKHPSNAYDDCKTSDYAGVVPTRAIVVGTEFCVLTGERRRALGIIRAVNRDPVTGLPTVLAIGLTVWDHLVPPGG